MPSTGWRLRPVASRVRPQTRVWLRIRAWIWGGMSSCLFVPRNKINRVLAFFIPPRTMPLLPHVSLASDKLVDPSPNQFPFQGSAHACALTCVSRVLGATALCIHAITVTPVKGNACGDASCVQSFAVRSPRRIWCLHSRTGRRRIVDLSTASAP
jgi:hypothetical protein